MTDASASLPIGHSRNKKLLDVASCLRDILIELPDPDDIQGVMNVSVKLDRIIQFMGSFPSAGALAEVVPHLVTINDNVLQMKNEIENRMGPDITRLREKVEYVSDQVSDLQDVITTESSVFRKFDHPTYLNERWVDLLPSALVDAASRIVVNFSEATESNLLAQIGISDTRSGSVTVITEDIDLPTTEKIRFAFPIYIDAGKYLRLRTFLRPYNRLITSLRARVNTRETQWGAHVYCYADTPYDGAITYDWEYNSYESSHSSNWYRIGRYNTYAERFIGWDTDYFCLPQERYGNISRFRCKVTQQRDAGSSASPYLSYSPEVFLTTEDLSVSATVLT